MSDQNEITYTTQDGRKISLPARLVGIKGYAAPPGSGPDGETCGSCKHHVVRQFAKNYHKCGLTNYTGGAATDIRVRSPACKMWQAIEMATKP